MRVWPPRRRAPAGLVLALALLPSFPVLASSLGPQPGVAGVPAGGGLLAEMTCHSCHATSPPNPDARGRVRLLGLPRRYEPGRRYELTFAVEHPAADRQRWGFQVTAVDASTLRGAGRFILLDAATTQLSHGSIGDRQYVGHAYAGTGVGEAGGMRWRFAWESPSHAGGEVAFYGTANAANADGAKEGDWIFSPSPEPLARTSPIAGE